MSTTLSADGSSAALPDLDPFHRGMLARLDGDRRTIPWATPGDLAVALDPKTVQTPALQLIDQALVDLANTPDGRLIISLPPQEGKSQRATRRFPEWLLARNPDLRIAIVSYAHSAARRMSGFIRDDIDAYGDRLGLAVRDDIAARNEWQIAGHDGGVYAVGIQGALTSRPVDVLIVDDPIKDRKQADSLAWRETAWDFWLEVGSTRLAPGAPVCVILTRWHEDDLAGRLVGEEDGHLWRVINIPAQADYDPGKGETDPLGRKPGEWLVSARGRTVEQWEAIKRRQITKRGSRGWNALYQGRPVPDAGNLLRRKWWQFHDGRAMQLDDGSMRTLMGGMVYQSWDLTFKDTRGSDFVVGQVWERHGVQDFLLDQVRDRMDFPTTVKAIEAMQARWPETGAVLVEDKANGPAVIASLRGRIRGLIAVEPKGGKIARAAAVSPFVEAGNVFLPRPEAAPWVGGLVDEAAAFPNAAHDDQVDALSQALAYEPVPAELVTDDDLGYERVAIGPSI